MLYVSVKRRFALGCFGLFLLFAEVGYSVSFSWPRCPERISRFVRPLLNSLPVVNHMAAAAAGTFGSAAISGVNILSPGNMALLALSQSRALLKQMGVRENATIYRAAKYYTQGVVATGILLPTIMSSTVSSAAAAAGMTTVFYLAHHFVALVTGGLCSAFMPEAAQKYVEPWLLAAGQVAMAALRPRLSNEDGAISEEEYWPKNLEEQSFWLASEENRYHCLAPDVLARGAAVTAKRFCTYQHLWFFYERSLRPLTSPNLCLEVAGGHGYKIPRLKPCRLAVAAQQWDYDVACDTQRVGTNPELIVVMNSKADAVISKNCYLFGIYPDKSSVQKQQIQDSEHLCSNENTQWILYRILWRHRPQSGVRGLSSVRYPIALNDFRALQTEYFRDFFNGIALMHRPEPYPRYSNQFPGTSTGVFSSNLTFECHFNYFENPGSDDNETKGCWEISGLYALAGQPVYVNVENMGSTPFTPMSMRFGVHAADDLCFSNARNTGWLKRPCRVSQVFSLYQGENWMRSQYGGALILVFQQPNIPKSIKVTIRHATSAPCFRVGVKTGWQTKGWQTELKQNKSPWAVLAGKYVNLHLPTTVARTIKDPKQLLAVYDRIIVNCRWLAGMSTIDTVGSARPGLSQHIVQDIIPVDPDTILGGLPVMVDESWHIADLDHMNYWGVFSQLGHNFQSTPLTGAFDKAALAGLFALYNQEQLGQDSRLFIEQRYSQAIAKVRSGQMVLAEAEPLEQLVFLMQIKHFITATYKVEVVGGEGKSDAGWLFYRKLNRSYSKLSDASQKAIAASRQQQFDSFYSAASKLSGYDLREHFEAWKVPISDAVKYEIEQLKLSQPSMLISELDHFRW